MSQLCLALDVPTIEQAEALVMSTAQVFDVYKIGLELFSAQGWRGVERIKASGAPAIFLDLKLHDIPRTVARSILRATVRGMSCNLRSRKIAGAPLALIRSTPRQPCALKSSKPIL